jgi:PPE-repeat protein
VDFAMLPPEINSGRMYAGPGSGPMLAAATAWNGLAADIESAASWYQSVISELTGGPWLGPASASMAAATVPYIGWMRTTAAQAAQTGAQAQAAAAAYEAAFAATVPPPVIVANRTTLMALVATNLFGQNTPAIAATEAQYAEMWAQDAAAMYGYAGSAATVTSGLPTFGPAPQTTSTALAGLASSAATSAAAGDTPLDTAANLAGLTAFVPGIVTASLEPVDFTADFTDFGIDDEDFNLEEQLEDAGYALVPLSPSGGIAAPTMGPAPLGAPNVPGLSASLGQTASVGGLSVPSAWTVAAPEIRSVAAVLPATGLSAAPQVGATSLGSLFSQMALAGTAGGTIGGTVSAGGGAIAEKLSNTTDQRARVAAALGGAVAGAGKVNPVGRPAGTGDGELLAQVAQRYPGVFALLDALCGPNEHSAEAGLARLEGEIVAFASRFTAAG